jgi:hypothetical protein
LQVHLYDSFAFTTAIGKQPAVTVRNGGALHGKFPEHRSYVQFVPGEVDPDLSARERGVGGGVWMAKFLCAVAYRLLSDRTNWHLAVLVQWLDVGAADVTGFPAVRLDPDWFQVLDAAAVESLVPVQDALGAQSVGHLAWANTWW